MMKIKKTINNLEAQLHHNGSDFRQIRELQSFFQNPPDVEGLHFTLCKMGVKSGGKSQPVYKKLLNFNEKK